MCKVSSTDLIHQQMLACFIVMIARWHLLIEWISVVAFALAADPVSAREANIAEAAAKARNDKQDGSRADVEKMAEAIADRISQSARRVDVGEPIGSSATSVVRSDATHLGHLLIDAERLILFHGLSRYVDHDVGATGLDLFRNTNELAHINVGFAMAKSVFPELGRIIGALGLNCK